MFLPEASSHAPLPSRIAMTGVHSFLGQLLYGRLVGWPGLEELHVFDVQPPPPDTSGKVVFHSCDLSADGAGSRLSAVLIHHHVHTLVHGALFSAPQRGRSRHRHKEVECIGTYHVLCAADEAKLQRLVMLSGTHVYGARPKNPNFLSEHAPLQMTGPAHVRARVDAETQALEFAAGSAAQVIILRCAPILGPNSSNLRARYFLTGLIPQVIGYDPLLQFLHEDDALKAVLLALTTPQARGPINVVGSGVIPLSTAMHMAGKIAFPVPGPICRAVFEAGYLSGVWDIASELVPFYQFLCVADGRKARHQLGFEAAYTSRQALRSMVDLHRLRKQGFCKPTPGLGEDTMALHSRGFERVQ